MGGPVKRVTEGTPQGSPAAMEFREEEGQGLEGPEVEETMGLVEEAAEEPGHKADIVPQELVLTLGLIVEDAP